jgi:hypothetical protein
VRFWGVHTLLAASAWPSRAHCGREAGMPATVPEATADVLIGVAGRLNHPSSVIHSFAIIRRIPAS